MSTVKTTLTRLREQEKGYTPSGEAQKAQETYQALKAGKPQAYASPYDDQIRAAYDRIANRPQFRYDLNADPGYQQYRSQAVSQGRRAMQDAQGRAAALTGGYGNSYAATAGNQAYQQYLEGLNQVIPQLYQQAYDRYSRQGEDLWEQYRQLLGREDTAYQRWQDDYSRWAQETQAARTDYESLREFEYRRWLDELNYWQQKEAQERKTASSAKKKPAPGLLGQGMVTGTLKGVEKLIGLFK